MASSVPRHADFGKLTNRLNLETAVQDGKVMQDFELESLITGGEHSQKVKVPPVISDYGSKGCVNLPSSTAVSRIMQAYQQISRLVIKNRSGVAKGSLCIRFPGVVIEVDVGD